MIDIENNIAEIKSKIQQLATKKALAPTHHSANSVTLIAVSKKQSAEAINKAISAGQKHFAENYLQEAELKMKELSHSLLVWHFIGSIQSNKTRVLAEKFDWVHTVERLKIAQRLSAHRIDNAQEPLNICLQVNIDKDPAKSGVFPEECKVLAKEVHQLPGICLRGLMTIPRNNPETSKIRESFAAMKHLFEEVKQHLNNPYFDSLSMGMSGDWQIAIEEGATMIRIGTAIFGQR